MRQALKWADVPVKQYLFSQQDEPTYLYVGIASIGNCQVAKIGISNLLDRRIKQHKQTLDGAGGNYHHVRAIKFKSRREALRFEFWVKEGRPTVSLGLPGFITEALDVCLIPEVIRLAEEAACTVPTPLNI